jgi:hypothetical protein
MTVLVNAISEDISTNATTTWTEKVGVAGMVDEGWYNIWVSCEYAGSSTSLASGVRILLDGVEVNLDQSYVAPAANAPRVFSSFGRTILAAGEHSISLQFRAEATPNTVSIRRARIMVMKD